MTISTGTSCKITFEYCILCQTHSLCALRSLITALIFKYKYFILSLHDRARFSSTIRSLRQGGEITKILKLEKTFCIGNLLQPILKYCIPSREFRMSKQSTEDRGSIIKWAKSSSLSRKPCVPYRFARGVRRFRNMAQPDYYFGAATEHLDKRLAMLLTELFVLQQ